MTLQVRCSRVVFGVKEPPDVTTPLAPLGSTLEVMILTTFVMSNIDLQLKKAIYGRAPQALETF